MSQETAYMASSNPSLGHATFSGNNFFSSESSNQIQVDAYTTYAPPGLNGNSNISYSKPGSYIPSTAAVPRSAPQTGGNHFHNFGREREMMNSQPLANNNRFSVASTFDANDSWQSDYHHGLGFNARNQNSGSNFGNPISSTSGNVGRNTEFSVGNNRYFLGQQNEDIYRDNEITGGSSLFQFPTNKERTSSNEFGYGRFDSMESRFH